MGFEDLKIFRYLYKLFVIFWIRLGSFEIRSVQGRSGSFRAVQGRSGPAVQGRRSGPFRGVQGRSGPFWGVLGHSGPFRVVQDRSGPFRAVQGLSSTLKTTFTVGRDDCIRQYFDQLNDRPYSAAPVIWVML